MEGGTGFEPVNGDFADHSVSLFATRPYYWTIYQQICPARKGYYINFTAAWQVLEKH